MSKSGWHQTAIARLHESLEAIKFDRENIHKIVQDHVEAATTPASEPEAK